MRSFLSFLLAVAALACASSCGGSYSSSGSPAPALGVTLDSSTSQVFQTQGPATVNVTVARNGVTGDVALTLTGLPAGAIADVQSPGAGDTGSVTFSPGSAAAGLYPLTIQASAGSSSGSSLLTLTIGAFTAVNTATNGRLKLAMSTSFQPAEWDYRFFQNFPSATAPLQDLQAQHVRLQGVSQAIPQTSDTTWDFTQLDAITQPVLGAGDHSPEFQIAYAPAFMYDANRNLLDPTYAQFTTYTQQLVQYYNTGGFTAPDGSHVSPSPDPITWWGIYNEPNINNVTADQYVQIYNIVVPAMQAVDPSLKFAALELSDFGDEEQKFVPTFVNGVTAQVDVLATHFYSSCNQSDSDQQVFSTVPGFADGVRYIYSQLQTNPVLSNVPVWVTENNVNADFDKGGGISACNNTPFTRDNRGSSAFFTAWRPYIFSQLGRAGAEALYHWDFAADAQFGELDDQTGQLRLSYWVDYWLQRMFPSPPGADILEHSGTDDGEIETLAVKNDDGSYIVMLANRALNSTSDNNGPGAPRVVMVDTSALGSFQTVSILTLDGATDVSAGPVLNSITPAAQIQISFRGYGVSFLKLQ